jgi:hypothetical protein
LRQKLTLKSFAVLPIADDLRDVQAADNRRNNLGDSSNFGHGGALAKAGWEKDRWARPG